MLGSAVSATMRLSFSDEWLFAGLWRAPFLAGIALVVPVIVRQRRVTRAGPATAVDTSTNVALAASHVAEPLPRPRRASLPPSR